jgi:choline dehydrogenase-like flavoprotein
MTAFDHVIVGAGTAGSVLAARLCTDRRVALVEAGGAPSDPDTADPLRWPALQGRAFDWRHATVPQVGTAGRVHAWPRGKVRGGSSVLNAMAHVRGHRADFDRWGVPGWGFDDLFPYFLRSENWTGAPSPWHGTGGPVHLVQAEPCHPLVAAYRGAAQALGMAPIADHNGPIMTGPTANTLTIKDGRRQSTADAYLTADVLARIALRENALVVALVFEGGRCVGVRLADGTTLRAERSVILAAGAIATPCLLMRAGIGDADALRALGIAARVDVPAVGRDLHDHLLSGGNAYRARRPVPPSRWQHSESLLYAHRSDAAPELVVACVVVPVVTEAFAAPALGEAYTLMAGFTHPRSRGSVQLASADPTVAPLIDPAYLAEPADRDAFLDALDLAQALGHAAPMDEWRAEEILPGPACADRVGRLRFMERAAYTHHHPVGTCRMGTDADAVVGPDLAVRGVEGLYVCDASVIPSITTGPINAAIIAMAERASDVFAGRAPIAPWSPPAPRPCASA